MTPQARESAARVYSLLLYLGPRSLRRAHGEQMRELFLDMLAGARARGRVAAARVWYLAAWDLARARLTRSFKRRPGVAPSVHERHQLMLGIDLKYTFRSLARQKLSTGARRRRC